MKHLSILPILLSLLIFSCSSEISVDDLIEDLKKTSTLDPVKIDQFIESVDAFVVKNPNSEKSPEYLELKAKYLTAMGKHQEALSVYDNIFNDFTSFSNHSDALFMKAFIYENNLNDKTKAEEHYKKYITKFPEGVFVKDAQFSLDNINKTPEELMEMFKRMNSDTSSTDLK